LKAKTDKENLLMVIPNYGFGGAQRVFSQLVLGLSDQYNIIEVVFNNSDTDKFNGIGTKVSLDVPAGKNLLTKALYFLFRIWKLNRLKAKFECKFSISHLEGANFVNILSFGPGEKVLCVHGSKTAEDSNRTGIIKLVENTLLIPVLFRFADKIVVVSKGISHELASTFKINPSRIQVIQNGINLKLIKSMAKREIPRKHRLIFTKPVLIFSGRLAPQKNPIALIDIYARIVTKFECNLLVLGDGPLKRDMQVRCTELGINYREGELTEDSLPCVLFIGFQQNPFQYLSKSRLFLLTSSFEGFPLAPCEALACHLPVIATDCPTGVREVLSHRKTPPGEGIQCAEYVEYGVLMPLIDRGTNYLAIIQEWCDTIITILTNDRLIEEYRMKAPIRASQLSERKTIGDWKRLLSQLHPQTTNPGNI